MQVAEFQALVKSDPEAAWKAMEAILVASCRTACLRARIDRSEAEDLAHDGLAGAAREEFAVLSGVDGKRSLRVWASGVARNLARKRIRDLARARRIEPTTSAGAPLERPTAGWGSLELSCLTDKQREALLLILRGRSEREAARALGVARATIQDRVQRAVRRLRRAYGTLPPLPEATRSWAEDLLERRPAWLTARHALCLRLYASGESRRPIADRMGATEEAVRSLVRRLKKRARAGSRSECPRRGGPTPPPAPPGRR